MNSQSRIEDDAMLIGQKQIIRDLDAVFDGMAIRCCVELRIADIIKNHNRPITLSEIAIGIDSPSVNLDGLGRLMRFLVRRKVFDETAQQEDDGEGETTYSLNHYSKWLSSDTNTTLAPYVMMMTNPFMVSPLQALSRTIKEGVTAFKITNGVEFNDACLHNSEFSRSFNEAMASNTTATMDAIISYYRDGFLCANGSVVDVGGGTGVAISEIVKAYPHLKGINFDLPHVISTAPTYDGVTHVAGDMFEAIPLAETIFMKSILQNWSDDGCVKILTNCRKAIPTESGKVIIVDIVQHNTQDDLLNHTRFAFDIKMFACFSSGRGRTESEWKKLLGQCGFYRYNIIEIPTILSIIEAFP